MISGHEVGDKWAEIPALAVIHCPRCNHAQVLVKGCVSCDDCRGLVDVALPENPSDKDIEKADVLPPQNRYQVVCATPMARSFTVIQGGV